MNEYLIGIQIRYINDINTLKQMLMDLAAKTDKLERDVNFFINLNVKLQQDYKKLQKQHELVCKAYINSLQKK